MFLGPHSWPSGPLAWAMGFFTAWWLCFKIKHSKRTSGFCIAFYDLSSRSCNLIFTVVTILPRFKGRKETLPLIGKKCQSHIIRTCGLGDTILFSFFFQKYILSPEKKFATNLPLQCDPVCRPLNSQMTLLTQEGPGKCCYMIISLCFGIFHQRRSHHTATQKAPQLLTHHNCHKTFWI